MRAVDMDAHRVVCRGIPWPSDCAPPSAKDMLARLERNEALISWLQPKGGGVEDQFPAIQVGAIFFTISLRMMKAVWRHVRLKRGFVNRETVPHVGVRLRIPTLLLCEKIRTQQRFNVSGARMGCDEGGGAPLFNRRIARAPGGGAQMMRVKQRVAADGGGGGAVGTTGPLVDGSAEEGIAAGNNLNNNNNNKRRRKGHPEACTAGEGARGSASSTTAPSVSACCAGGASPCNFRDMLWVVENWIMPAEPAAPSGAAHDPVRGVPPCRDDDPCAGAAWAGITRFRLDETELFENLVYQMRRDCPRLCSELSSSSSSSSFKSSPSSSMALLILGQPDG